MREQVQKAAAQLLSMLAAKLQPPPPPEEREYRVVITGIGEPTTEIAKAKSPVQAAELAANVAAHRRLLATSERSWRVKALVDEYQFDVVVSCYLKAEVCGP
jgi:adenine C2-methylase RlmN of 23S rRNA A2503 and tRNA A37